MPRRLCDNLYVGWPIVCSWYHSLSYLLVIVTQFFTTFLSLFLFFASLNHFLNMISHARPEDKDHTPPLSVITSSAKRLPIASLGSRQHEKAFNDVILLWNPAPHPIFQSESMVYFWLYFTFIIIFKLFVSFSPVKTMIYT